MLFCLVRHFPFLWFIRVSKRKWAKDRPAAWVYLISSLISIILVFTAIPNTITSFTQPTQQQEQQPTQEQPQEHNHNEHF